MDSDKSKYSDIDQMALLKEAFDSFNTATAELQQSYNELKQKVNELNIELDETNKELKKNLKEKEELKEYLQNVLENAPNGVIVIDNRGCIKDFNKAAEGITGHTFKEVKGENITKIIPNINKNKERDMLDSVEFKSLPGEEKILNVYISKLKDTKKRKIGSVIAIEDISGFKRLEEQLQRKNRLEAMGEMAAGISHEIRNPLGAIELFASMLRKDLKGEAQKEELADNIISGVKSLSNITSNLLLFTKNVKPKREEVNVGQVIDDALIFTEHAAQSKDINIKKNIDKKLKKIHADNELLKQVILNLVLNSVQSLKKGGNITISAENVKKSGMSINDKKEYIKLMVEDTGTGISKENIEKIFNPFYTTKRSGLGLGLAIVHKIITAHNGIIDVSSEEGKNARFSIMLPVN